MIAPFLLVPPLVAILLIAIIRNQKAARYIALLSSLAALALFPFVSGGTYSVNWIQIAGSSLSLVISVAPLNLLLLGIVLAITPLIFLFSFGFMDTLSEQRRFYLEILAFQVSMLLFSMSGSFITMLLAWEFLSVTSYLLIGFWYTKEKTVRAARKALTVVLIGDLAILAAIAIFWGAFGTLQFSAIIASLPTANPTYLYAASALLVVAILTKSAQFPFHDWLPDAMEGPTPVSAYLHSTTMVKAGAFLVVLLLPIFVATNLTTVLLVLGIITAAIATFYALKEFHVKRIVAYSTIQELSLMIIAFSSGAVLAGVYFFFVQSFYKAIFFFAAGSAMKATGKEDLREVGGIMSNKLLFITTLFGVLSAVGFIPFSGFFAGEDLSYSLASNLPVYIFISVISFATSIYSFRWLIYLSKKARSKDAEVSFATLPKSMIAAMAVLAVLVVAASVAFGYIASILNASRIPDLANHGFTLNAYDSIVYTVLLLLGAYVSYAVYAKRIIDVDSRRPYVEPQSISSKAYKFIARLEYHISDGIAFFDNYLNEFFDAIGRSVVGAGRAIRRLSVGEINYYALILAVGLIAIFAYVYLVY